MVSVKLPVRKAPVALKEEVADNNRKLHSLLQRCSEKDIKLNKDKLKLQKKEVTFMGHVISAEGLKPHPTKIEAVLSMPNPTNKQDVRRLLGMVKLPQKILAKPIRYHCTTQKVSPRGHVSMEPTSTRYLFPSLKDSTHHSSPPQVL